MELDEATQVVARRVRLLRGLCGWSDRELGERTGLSREQVESRLTVKRKPTRIGAGEVLAFADAFGVPVDLLYMDDDADFLRKIADLDVPLTRWTTAWAGRLAS